MSIIREHIVKRITRSGKWPKFIRDIKKVRGKCAICGKTNGLEGHHIRPFRLYPELELIPSNIYAL